jgi:hypothetical protein
MSDQASSTDTSGSADLKAGHAPASKNKLIGIEFNSFFCVYS